MALWKALVSNICLTHRSVYIYLDAVPPIHAVSYHVATDNVPAQNGDKLRSIFSDNLQPIATRGKKARGTLLVDKHCGNGCSIKCAPLSVSNYNEISGGHIGRAVVRTRYSAGPVLPLWFNCICNHLFRRELLASSCGCSLQEVLSIVQDSCCCVGCSYCCCCANCCCCPMEIHVEAPVGQVVGRVKEQ